MQKLAKLLPELFLKTLEGGKEMLLSSFGLTTTFNSGFSFIEGVESEENWDEFLGWRLLASFVSSLSLLSLFFFFFFPSFYLTNFCILFFIQILPQTVFFV